VGLDVFHEITTICLKVIASGASASLYIQQPVNRLTIRSDHPDLHLIFAQAM
jgi:hypothetical protein